MKERGGGECNCLCPGGAVSQRGGLGAARGAAGGSRGRTAGLGSWIPRCSLYAVRSSPSDCCGPAGRVSCPSREPSVGSPAESWAPWGSGSEGRGRRETPRGARTCRLGWLFVRKANVKLTVSNRPTTSGWYFFFLHLRENAGGEGVSQRGCKNAYLEHR